MVIYNLHFRPTFRRRGRKPEWFNDRGLGLVGCIDYSLPEGHLYFNGKVSDLCLCVHHVRPRVRPYSLLEKSGRSIASVKLSMIAMTLL